MAREVSAASAGRKETLQVLAFLREFDQIRQPPIRHLSRYEFTLRQRDIPQGPGVDTNLAAFGGEEAEDLGGNLADAVLLSVERQTLTKAPAPRDEWRPWIKTEGSDPTTRPAVHRYRTDRPVQEAPSPTDAWTANPARVVAFETWVDTVWTPWAQAERQRRQVQQLYEHLFQLYLQLRRDSELVELIWGYGLLSWQVAVEDVWHPLLTARVELSFDRIKAILRVHPTSAVPEIASEILSGAPPEQLDEFRRFEQDFRKAPIAPWDVAHAKPVLQQALHSLDVNGHLVEGEATPPPSAMARIVPESVLLLRRRRSGYHRDIEQWEEILRKGEAPAAPVAAIVSIPSDGAEESSVSPMESQAPAAPVEGSWQSLEKELLLPLPSNQEQREIARRLARHHGVVVQGPPGTGKTHAVANLLCHLLAHGKTVLVTAQTDRALRVLRAKVPKAIRSLCVSVLARDVDAQEELRESVQTIVAESARGDGVHTATASRARDELRTVQTQLNELWGRMGAARRAERSEISIGGRTWTPSTIGDYLRSHADEDGWLPDPLEPGTTPPLTTQELGELFGLLGSHARIDLEEGLRDLPNPASLPSAETFRTTHATRRNLRVQIAARPTHIQQWMAPEDLTPAGLTETLQALRADLERALEDLQAFQAGWLHTIRHQIGSDPSRLHWWQEIVGEMDSRRQEITTRRRKIIDRKVMVRLPGSPDELLAAVTALHAYVAGGGGFGRMFGLLHGTLKATRDGCYVDSHPPNNVGECEAVIDHLTVLKFRYHLGRIYANELQPLGAPEIKGEPYELTIEPSLSTLRKLLGWREKTWEPLIGRLARVNCRVRLRLQGTGELQPAEVVRVEEQPGDEVGTVRAILEVLNGALEKLQLSELDAWRSRLGETLDQGRVQPNAAGVWRRLREAWETERAELWAEALDETARLAGIRPALQRFRTLYTTLRTVTPQWASQLLELAGDPVRAVVPPRLAEAWLWRQLETWLVRHLNAESAESLRQQIDRLQTKERRLIEAQVTHATWAAQIARVKDPERQALNGWQQTIQKLGKGFRKRAAELKREAQNLMNQCRGAVPVWIMPLARVVENFAPGGRKFDVVITDESSQLDSYGILALLRAERAIVIGDNMQISPAAVGVPVDRVKELMDKHLAGVPAKHLYDGQQSLYDMATRAFAGTIRLREHFRCMPEIIAFSNQFYHNEIRPLRDPASSTLLPPVVLHKVSGYRPEGSKVNEVEAAEVAALIAAVCNHPAYNHCTIGAISLLGEDQARAIYERVIRLVSEEELDRRNFVCGDAYHFQGDERDVMFLSLVETGDGRMATLNRLPDVQRFNVAASRPKDQLWVVHTAEASAFHPEDLRGRLLRFYSGEGRRIENWKHVEEILQPTSRDDEFFFQRKVAKAIVDRGYAVRAEVRVGHYRIDLVVDGITDSLAVECDGDRWHTLEHEQDDVARQMILERLGWRFVRIRGGEFFRNPERTLEPLWTRLEELGIRPVETNGSPAPTEGVTKEIIEDARRRREAMAPSSVDGEGIPFGPEGGPAVPREPTGELTVTPEWPLGYRSREAETPAATAPSPPSIRPIPSRLGRARVPERLEAVFAFAQKRTLERLSEPARKVYDWLQDNSEWHGRADIVAGSGIDIEQWREAIAELSGAQLIEATGSRRITMYRVRTG